MVLMRISGTAVTVKPTVLVLLAGVWGVVTWVGFRRHPKRRFGEGLLVGLASFVALAVVEWGHAFAHIIRTPNKSAVSDLVSARYRAPGLRVAERGQPRNRTRKTQRRQRSSRDTGRHG